MKKVLLLASTVLLTVGAPIVNAQEETTESEKTTLIAPLFENDNDELVKIVTTISEDGTKKTVVSGKTEPNATVIVRLHEGSEAVDVAIETTDENGEYEFETNEPIVLEDADDKVLVLIAKNGQVLYQLDVKVNVETESTAESTTTVETTTTETETETTTTESETESTTESATESTTAVPAPTTPSTTAAPATTPTTPTTTTTTVAPATTPTTTPTTTTTTASSVDVKVSSGVESATTVSTTSTGTSTTATPTTPTTTAAPTTSVATTTSGTALPNTGESSRVGVIIGAVVAIVAGVFLILPYFNKKKRKH